MFDGPTSPGLRLDGPLVVLDLSAVYHSPALGVLMACAAAWLRNAVRARHRNRIIVVVDEAWAIRLGDEGCGLRGRFVAEEGRWAGASTIERGEDDVAPTH